jgi:hypothetical protein
LLFNLVVSLNPLYLALRALDAHQFELLVTQLLKAQYPGVDIKHVDGRGGDDGLDIISGDLDSRPTIWQCKSFASGIGKSQKAQIAKSFKQALRFSPRRWILCLSVDMDSKATGWFQDLARKAKANNVEVEFMGATEIVRQLLYQQTITENFFPGVVINISAIREQLARTKHFSVQELADLSGENTQVYLSRLQSYDARFLYQLTVGRDKEASTEDAPKGALLSIYRGGSALHVFPRDVDALRANPAKLRLNLDERGKEKVFENLRTGAPQNITPHELGGFSSDFDFLLPVDREGMSLTVRPVASNETIPLRFVFGRVPNAVVYEYLAFRRTQGGTEETTFESVSPLPFSISFVVRLSGTDKITFTRRSGSYPLETLLKQARAIELGVDVGFVEIYDPETGRRVGQGRMEGSLPEYLGNYFKVLKLAEEVSRIYGISLTVPDEISRQDYDNILMLNTLESGLSVTLNEVSMEIEKTHGLTLDSGLKLDGPNKVRLCRDEYPDEIFVFGTRVLTGPVQYDISAADIRDPERWRKFITDAPVGTLLLLTLFPRGPVLCTRIRK